MIKRLAVFFGLLPLIVAQQASAVVRLTSTGKHTVYVATLSQEYITESVPSSSYSDMVRHITKAFQVTENPITLNKGDVDERINLYPSNRFLMGFKDKSHFSKGKNEKWKSKGSAVHSICILTGNEAVVTFGKFGACSCTGTCTSLTMDLSQLKALYLKDTKE